MRKILILGACCLAMTGCSLAPGLYVKTDNLHTDSQNVAPMVKPVLIPINSNITYHKSADSSCSSNNDSWICENSNDYQYKIGAGDILTIVVYDHPELTNPQGEYISPEESGMPVNTDGTIDYPFIGRVEVAGLTVEQLADLLKEKLATYIQSPQINVRVSMFNYEKVQVLGEVMMEKTLPITNVPLSLLDAVNAAGGFNLNTADAKYIYVIRGPANRPTVYWLNASEPDALLLSENFYLKNHDIVYVSTADIARWQRVISGLLPSVQGAESVNSTVK